MFIWHRQDRYIFHLSGFIEFENELVANILTVLLNAKHNVTACVLKALVSLKISPINRIGLSSDAILELENVLSDCISMLLKIVLHGFGSKDDVSEVVSLLQLKLDKTLKISTISKDFNRIALSVEFVQNAFICSKLCSD